MLRTRFGLIKKLAVGGGGVVVMMNPCLGPLLPWGSVHGKEFVKNSKL